MLQHFGFDLYDLCTNIIIQVPLPICGRYHLDLCKYVFGKGTYPDVDMTNIYYGGLKIAGLNMTLLILFFDLSSFFMFCGSMLIIIFAWDFELAGSKIVFTNGSQDPWRHASKQISSQESKIFFLHILLSYRTLIQMIPLL